MKPLVLTNRKSLYARLGALAVMVAAGLFTTTTNGCNQGAEGDRCNPYLIPSTVSSNPAATYNEDECGQGLSCQIPMNCPEAYCCSTSGDSKNPFCQQGCNGGALAGCLAGNMDDCAFLDGGTE